MAESADSERSRPTLSRVGPWQPDSGGGNTDPPTGLVYKSSLSRLRPSLARLRFGIGWGRPSHPTRLCHPCLGLEDIVVFSDSRLIISFQMGNCFFSKKDSGGYDSDKKIDFKRGNVHVITSKESWDEKILEANRHGKMVVVNFSASWCGPCRMIVPLYSELSEKYPSITFLTIDVDEMADFSSSWDIRATPTFFFLRDGQQVDKLVGANKPELQKKVTAYADSSSQLS
ncbi:hypothetical protein Taro_041398 [Colocasia esculenta]|uniref:Thioredoxin domain-containing protein n=1 Tax=Colocasia esculenta TaxID=4460 RepID=A0A843WEB0_COLES|nr:hypothetical protein [Colocasia esculenta]